MGLGLTNECNLACAFCYRDPARVDRLSLDQVRSAMESLPVRSVNLGTGENGMHPQFHQISGYLRTLPVKLTITSMGIAPLCLPMMNSGRFTILSSRWTIPLARAGCATRRWQLEIDSRTGGALCSTRNSRYVHQRDDEGQLSAVGGGGAHRQALRIAAAR